MDNPKVYEVRMDQVYWLGLIDKIMSLQFAVKQYAGIVGPIVIGKLTSVHIQDGNVTARFGDEVARSYPILDSNTNYHRADYVRITQL